MNKMKLLPMLLVLSLVLIALSGCTNSNYKAPATPPASGGDTIPVVNTAPTSESIAMELSSGTGTGSNDVSDADIDGLQNDLDEIDVADNQSEESNI